MKEFLRDRIAALLAETGRTAVQFEIDVRFFTHHAPLPDAENPKISHPVRRAQWAEGQRGKIFIENSLKKTVLFTVTHSEFEDSSTVLVLGVEAAPHMKGVGIDLERLDREVSQGAAAKFVLMGEESLALTPLELFSLKEAAFKSNPQNEGTVISEYRVSAHPKLKEVFEIKGPGPYLGQGAVYKISGWCVSVALA